MSSQKTCCYKKKRMEGPKFTFYKIVCNDPEITDCYVGQTTNLKQRIYTHKISCNNEKYSNYNYPLYKRIRECGGFDNWRVVELESVICDKKQAYEIENFLWRVEGATLNRCIPNATCSKTRSEYGKEYERAHKEERAKYDKKYHESHKDDIAKRQKEYYESHKDKILEHKTKRVNCDLCGKEVSYGNLTTHKKRGSCI